MSEEVQALRQALWALPAEYREPLLLQTLGGLCCEEIAAELALPVGRVMTRYFRARHTGCGPCSPPTTRAGGRATGNEGTTP